MESPGLAGVSKSLSHLDRAQVFLQVYIGILMATKYNVLCYQLGRAGFELGVRRYWERLGWVVVVVGSSGQTGPSLSLGWLGKVGVKKTKDKTSKDEQKAYLLCLRTGADTLWKRVVVEESWGCRWPSSPPRLSGVSTVVIDARAWPSRGGDCRCRVGSC